jgi:hypothetical protein
MDGAPGLGEGEVPWKALLPPPGTSTYGSRGLLREESNCLPVLPAPDGQSSHWSLSGQDWGTRKRLGGGEEPYRREKRVAKYEQYTPSR